MSAAIGSKVLSYQPGAAQTIEGALRISTTLSHAGQVYRLATGNIDGQRFETTTGSWADGLYALDIVNTAFWWVTAERKSWQHTASNVVGTVRQLVHCVEYAGIDLNAIAGTIGKIPVLSVVMPVLRSVDNAFGLGHQILVYRQKDDQQKNIDSLYEKADGEKNTAIQKNIREVAEKLGERLEITNKQMVVGILYSINQIALGILTVVVVVNGGAAAVATSLPLAIFGCYAQGYGVFMFFFNIHTAPASGIDNPTRVDAPSDM